MIVNIGRSPHTFPLSHMSGGSPLDAKWKIGGDTSAEERLPDTGNEIVTFSIVGTKNFKTYAESRPGTLDGNGKASNQRALYDKGTMSTTMFTLKMDRCKEDKKTIILRQVCNAIFLN